MPSRLPGLLLLLMSLALGLTGCADDEPASEGGPRLRERVDKEGDRRRDRGRDARCADADADPVDTGPRPQLTEVAADLGLVEPLKGMYGHAAAAADVDGDGRTDLFVGTFADKEASRYRVRGAIGPAPDRILLNTGAGFRVGPDLDLAPGRTTGAVFADLDGAGGPELIVVRNRAGRDGRPDGETVVLRNRDGVLTAPLPLDGAPAAARAAVPLDFDSDGDLDVIVTADPLSNDHSVVLRNGGDMRFEDVTADVGWPDDVQGLAAVAADFTGDGRPDVLVSGDRRAFVNNDEGGFDMFDVPAMEWDLAGTEDLAAGMAVGDLDGDGRLDVVAGHHFGSTDRDCRVAVRVLRNDSSSGRMALDEARDVGIPALAVKAPHPEVIDVDGDGDLDVLTSADVGGGPQVLVNDGKARFTASAGEADGHYWVTGVATDFDGDGGSEVFLVENDPALPSTVWKSKAPESFVTVDTGPRGYGCVVAVRTAKGDERTAEVVAGSGYAAGRPPSATFADVGDRVEVIVGNGPAREAASGDTVRFDGCGRR